MAETLEKTDYDVVIVGTGIVESMVAAAMACEGKTVLHVDLRHFYGATSGSLTISEAIKMKSILVPDVREDSGEEVSDKPGIVLAPQHGILAISASDPKLHPELIEKDRRFSLDILPKLIKCRSKMVDLIIRSRTGRYLEFLPVENIAILKEDGTWSVVPLSKSDVFRSREVTMQQKRYLGRFMSYCSKFVSAWEQQETSTNDNNNNNNNADADADAADADADESRADTNSKTNTKPDSSSTDELDKQGFLTFLHSFQLPITLQDVILYGICECHSSDEAASLNAQAGMEHLASFLVSLGRYAPNAAIMLVKYGMGDIAQAYCRLSAVSGATYITGLGQGHLEAGQLHLGTQTITMQHCCVGADMCPPSNEKRGKEGENDNDNDNDNDNANENEEVRLALRGMLLIKGEEGPLGVGKRGWGIIPPTHPAMDGRVMHVMQYDASTGAVPDGYILIQCQCLLRPSSRNESSPTHAESYRAWMENVLCEVVWKDSLWHMVFVLDTTPRVQMDRSLNVQVATACPASLDGDDCLDSAEKIVRQWLSVAEEEECWFPELEDINAGDVDGEEDVLD